MLRDLRGIRRGAGDSHHARNIADRIERPVRFRTHLGPAEKHQVGDHRRVRVRGAYGAVERSGKHKPHSFRGEQ